MRFRRLTFFAVACMAALGLFAAAGGAGAAENSPYGVYVQDEAGVLSRQTQDDLYRQAVWLHEQTGTAQIGVVTVPDLGGGTIEEAAVTRFRKMGLGGKERNDGVLLIYAKQENRVRIEVGYGMEGRIPDGKAGTILDQYFVPYRDKGRFDEAFFFTQSALVQEMAAEYGIDASQIGSGDMPSPQVQQDGKGVWASVPWYLKLLGGIGIVLLLFLDFKFTGGAVTFAILNSIGRRGSGGRGGGWGGGRGGGGSSGGGGASR